MVDAAEQFLDAIWAGRFEHSQSALVSLPPSLLQWFGAPNIEANQ
jgi:hypothetical protein